MKYLIIGLGNMGIDYEGTRHNVGFALADLMVEDAGETYKHESLGELAMIKHKGRRIYVLKPSTYMNRSGKAVRYWMQKLKIPIQNVLVVVDEIQLPFGAYKLTKKGKDGGHNGLRDIQNHLQTTSYARLRIGIGRDFHPGQQVQYVLGKWSEDQLKGLPGVLETCAKICLSYAAIGPELTMTQFNQSGKKSRN